MQQTGDVSVRVAPYTAESLLGAFESQLFHDTPGKTRTLLPKIRVCLRNPATKIFPHMRRTPQDIQKKGNLAPAEGRTHWLQPMGGVSLSKYLVGGLHRV